MLARLTPAPSPENNHPDPDPDPVMLSGFLRLFTGTKAPTPPARAQDVVRAVRPELPRPEPRDAGIRAEHDAGTPTSRIAREWTPRPAEYWPQRTAHVLQRLEQEWMDRDESRAYPDVAELLASLGAEPDAVIRQLPAAARDAIAICDDPGMSRGSLAERLGQDPSLMQGLLRQANGAWYGAGLQSVLRVDGAIDRIGIAGTRAVVMASCVDGLLAKPGGAYDAMVGSVWSHMVQAAPVARAIGPVLGADGEEAFAITLLHDVGKLVVFDRIAALRMTHRRAIQIPEAWLSHALEQLHEPLGATAAHLWGLGAAAADAIGTHHRKERPSCRHPLAETLFVSERADHARREGSALDFDGVWALGEVNGDVSICRGILARQERLAA